MPKANIFERLPEILKKDERIASQDGQILKNKAQELARKNDPELIKLLFSDSAIKEHFFFRIEEALVFDKEKFIRFVSNKQFLPDSYTAFKNKIGFVSGDDYFSEHKEVALAWPYKDCVLEGGMTKEDQKRDEIFYNETLAPDDVNRLLDPKVFINFKRIDKSGENALKEFKKDEKGDIEDNFIIKGNNLLVLASIKERFAEKVKLIYIDPPYNTGNDGFKYNDSFNHSSWLTFMKNRLDIAKGLLSSDGSIWINIDDNESHYLKVLCDEIFGRENFVANVVWNKKNVVQNDAKYFNQNHDHILVFAKNKTRWSPNLLERTDEMNARYDNPDNDPRGSWTSVALQAKSGSENNIYEIEFSNGVKWSPVPGTYPRLSKESLLAAYNEGRLWFGKNGRNVPRMKKYLNEVQQGLVPSTIFSSEDSGSTQQAKEELKKILGKNIFDTPKPEKLLHKILSIGSKEKDLVLDFFAGSGTTLAAAHKTGRQYIGIEQMDYIHDLPESRIKKVIEGEQGGISEAVNWQGGGDFVYMELMEWNEKWEKKIKKAENKEELAKIWDGLKDSSFLSWRIDPKKFDPRAKDFADLDIETQKKFLLECLNKNHLYVNYSEIEDKDYGVSEGEIGLNRGFYGSSN